jgi:hypothetical protein
VTASEATLAATFCTSKASTLVPVKQEYRSNGSVRPHVASDSKRGQSAHKPAEDPRSEVKMRYATCCVCVCVCVCVHVCVQRLLRQFLHFCTSKASKLSTFGEAAALERRPELREAHR